jgi:CRISPR/Cas system-associated endonuclease/helicase Cas3
MNDFIQRIGPVERDIDPVYRVERAHDEGEKREPEQRKKQPPRETQTQTETDETAGPVEGDDGHLHIDVRA